MFSNLKTTTAGAALIMSGLTGFLHLINPEVPGPDIGTSATAIIGGLGLIFAQDNKPAAK